MGSSFGSGFIIHCLVNWYQDNDVVYLFHKNR